MRVPEDPEVIVDFEFAEGLLHVVVRNIGARPAYRVSTRFDKPFHGLQGTREISALRLFRNIEFLAPARENRALPQLQLPRGPRGGRSAALRRGAARRGFVGDLALYDWWNEVRNGGQDFRTVRIELQTEDHSRVVASWTLHRAWPARIAFGPLRGLGDEVLVETLELAFDTFELE